MNLHPSHRQRTRRLHHTMASLAALFAALFSGCTTTPAPTASAWPTRLPEAVASFGATATAEGTIYVYGGYRGERHEYNRDDVSGTLWRWSSGGQDWEPLPTAGISQGSALVTDGRQLFRMGGMAARNAKGSKQDLASQDVAARFDGKAWQSLPPLPNPRSSHDAAWLDHKLYVAGGWTLPGSTNRGVWLDHMLVLDLKQRPLVWREIPQPFKRRALSVAAVGGRIYCIGGMDDADTTCRDVDVYDTRTGQWSKGPALPKMAMNGFGCAAVAVDGRILVSGFSGSLLRLGADGSEWEKIAQLQTPRFFHRLVAIEPTRVLALGGEDKSGKLNGCELIAISNSVSTPPLAASSR